MGGGDRVDRLEAIAGVGPPASEQAGGIPRRDQTVIAGCGDSLVIAHGEGGVPPRLSAEDAPLAGRCNQPRAKDRATGTVPQIGSPPAAV